MTCFLVVCAPVSDRSLPRRANPRPTPRRRWRAAPRTCRTRVRKNSRRVAPPGSTSARPHRGAPRARRGPRRPSPRRTERARVTRDELSRAAVLASATSPARQQWRSGRAEVVRGVGCVGAAPAPGPLPVHRHRQQKREREGVVRWR